MKRVFISMAFLISTATSMASPPLCTNGETIVVPGYDKGGCQAAPICVNQAMCATYSAPLCADGETIIVPGYDKDGCQAAPICVNQLQCPVF